MFLRSLQMKGFKSFADPVTLEFEPGVTVVVGPNGSGKSNIVDAIAWVLGAQGAKALRGARMEDVIFAGSSGRPPLGRAEVTLTIDNSDRGLPLDMAEVSVTRTLFRDGASEYAINGASCRLLDVQELLSDAGVGRSQHVILGQGQLDAVLEARPEERRAAIEEAAGVLKYRRRRERAERRLEATEADLLRATDLSTELRRQMRPLERQAEAARRHQRLTAELAQLRYLVAAAELDALRASQAQAEAMVGQLALSEASAVEELAGLDQLLESAESEHGADDHSRAAEAQGRAQAVLERARSLTRLLSEREKALAAELERQADEDIAEELADELGRLRFDREEAESSANSLVPASEELALAESALAEERAAIEQAALAGSNRSTGAAHSGPDDPSLLLATARSRVATLHQGVGRLEIELDHMRQRSSELAWRCSEEEAENAALAIRLASATEELDLAAEAARKALGAAEAAQSDLAEADSALAEARLVKARNRSLVDGLEKALAEVGQGDGIQLLEGVGGVLGRLSDLVSVDKGWEEAFSAAVGEALSGVVVSDLNSAKEAATALVGASGSERVKLLLAGVPGPAGAPTGGGGGLRDHVRPRIAGLEDLLDRLLSGVDALGTGWQEALEVHLRSPERVVVTVGGERFGLAYWSIGGQGPGVGVLALADAKVSSLEADAAAAQVEQIARAARELAASCAADFQQASKIEAAALAQVAAVRRELERLEQRGQAQASEMVALEEHLRSAEGRLEADREAVSILEDALPSLVVAAEEEERNRQAAAAAELLAADEIARRRSALDERTAAVAALRRDLEVRAASIEERRRMLDDRCLDLEYRLVQLSKSTEQREARRQRASEVVQVVRRLDDLVGGLAQEAQPLHTRLLTAASRAEEQWRLAGGRLSSLRLQRGALEARLTAYRQQLSDARITLAQAELRLESALASLPGDTEAPVLDSEEVPPDAVERIGRLEVDLARLGPVNPLAATELSELSGRADELDAQLEDVRNSRSELRRVVKAIDDEIAERFQAALADAAASFTRLFEILFPGGSGRLRTVMVDDDPMGGVEIEARPAGARVRMLSLLSGGERSLAALAFSFALFQARPSPFYVLDEVEAALDDVNLRRFLLLAEELRSDAQLIIITHQRRTMEMADCLYGVTMRPGGGGSKVVGERIGARSLAM